MIFVRKIKRNSAAEKRQFTLYRVVLIERDAIAKNAEQRKESSKRGSSSNFTTGEF